MRVQVPAGLLVGDARVDGRPVSLVDQPSPHVLLSKRGRSVLTLQIVLPLKAAGVGGIARRPAGRRGSDSRWR